MLRTSDDAEYNCIEDNVSDIMIPDQLILYWELRVMHISFVYWNKQKDNWADRDLTNINRITISIFLAKYQEVNLTKCIPLNLIAFHY